MKLDFKFFKSSGYHFSAILVIIVLWLQLTPGSLQQELNGVCRVEARSLYFVTLPGNDTLWLSAAEGMATKLSGDRLLPDTVVCSGLVAARSGRVVTSASAVHFAADELRSDTLGGILKREKVRLERLLRNKREAEKELDYYARTHSVEDDGYNEVMEYRAVSEKELRHVERQLALVEKALQAPALTARLRADFIVDLAVVPSGRETQVSTYRYAAQMVGRSDSLLLLQTKGAQAFPATAHVFRRGGGGWLRRDAVVLGHWESGSLPVAAPTDSIAGLALTSLDGAPVVDGDGRLTAIRLGGGRFSLSALHDLFFNYRPRYEWWWNDLKTWTRYLCQTDNVPAPVLTAPLRNAETHAASVAGFHRRYGRLQLKEGNYVGRLEHGQPEGVGQMVFDNGTVYTGSWKKGRREGRGVAVDSSGLRYEGFWQADSLLHGYCKDDTTAYAGGFNKALQPHGAGRRLRKDGTYYSGAWVDGRRQGFGFAVGEGKMVRAGVWKNGRFRGEQMVYTADRVYGIDISRYQHEIAGRRYGIDWKRMRITGLGTASRKRIKGHTDYPVSFVYIKATEGITVKNRYYAADAAAARRQGIHRGAYHFFSTKTSGRRQARFFLSVAKPGRGDLPPVLDVEPSDRQIEAMGGPAKMFREIMDWMRLVRRQTGVSPVLYVSQSFVNKYMEHAPSELLQAQVWIARYGEYKPYTHLLYWQLAYDGRVAGIHGGVDINVFNGTREDFETYVRENVIR